MTRPDFARAPLRQIIPQKILEDAPAQRMVGGLSSLRIFKWQRRCPQFVGHIRIPTAEVAETHDQFFGV
jgi:hypothetical protein